MNKIKRTIHESEVNLGQEILILEVEIIVRIHVQKFIA